MAIPDYQTIMLPLLKFASDGKEHSLGESIESLADEFQLTEEERKELLPSGTQRLFNNRVAWANTYLRKAGLLVSTKRGYFKIADRGYKILEQNLERIDVKFLKQFPEIIEFLSPKKKPLTDNGNKTELTDERSPNEVIETAVQELYDVLSSDLLETIKARSPEFFEELVIDVLIRMGYGGSRRDAGRALGKTGDGGIDGIIKEDKLGLDVIYIQAKKWDTTVVGRPEIQKFAGALQMKKANKGIFITTSKFSREALESINEITSKIILIDGPKLAELMIEHNVGINVDKSYEIKKIDFDYFPEG